MPAIITAAIVRSSGADGVAAWIFSGDIQKMAEREGFEPPVAFRPQQFSRLPVSTAHTPLHARRAAPSLSATWRPTPRVVVASHCEKGKNSMPAKKKSGGRKYGKAAGKSVKSAMHRKKKGTLKSGKGGKGGTVKSRKQAIAIGLSEARKKGAKVPKKK